MASQLDQPQSDRRMKIVKYYTERVTQLLAKTTDKWKISEEIVFDAFMEFCDGFLDDAHVICLYGLHNNLVSVGAYHAACLHAILSTYPFAESTTHASHAYRLVAEDFETGVDNFKSWSTSFAYLSQASWGLSAFSVKKQWETMMRQHLHLEWSVNDKEEAVPKAENTLRSSSSRSFAKPKLQSNVAVALDSFEAFEALERALQEEGDLTPTQSILEQEGISHNSNGTVPHDDRTSEPPTKLHQDADDSTILQQQNGTEIPAVASSDTRVYEDDDFEYYIVDLEEYNRQVAAAALVDLKSRSTTSDHAQASQPSSIGDDAQAVIPGLFEKVAGHSPHPIKPDVLPSAPVQPAAPSLAVDGWQAFCGRTSPPKDDTRCLSDNSSGSRSDTPPPEDHTASDFKSENSEVDSDVESEIWDAMYNDRYLDRAKERLESWKINMKTVKGEIPELFDQIIYFLRTLRNLWQSGQPDCRQIVVDPRLRKLWRARFANACEEYDEKLRKAGKGKKGR